MLEVTVKTNCIVCLEYYSNIPQICIVILLKNTCILIEINAYTQFVDFVKDIFEHY